MILSNFHAPIKSHSKARTTTRGEFTIYNMYSRKKRRQTSQTTLRDMANQKYTDTGNEKRHINYAFLVATRMQPGFIRTMFFLLWQNFFFIGQLTTT